MRISIDSWHYKLVDGLDLDHCQNLCGYFWQVVSSVFLVVVVFPAMGLAVLWFATLPFWHIFIDGYLVEAVLAGSVEILGLSVLLRIIIKVRHEDEILAGERKRSSSEPSLAYSWIKAKHDKICPLIEFHP